MERCRRILRHRSTARPHRATPCALRGKRPLARVKVLIEICGALRLLLTLHGVTGLLHRLQVRIVNIGDVRRVLRGLHLPVALLSVHLRTLLIVAKPKIARCAAKFLRKRLLLSRLNLLQP